MEDESNSGGHQACVTCGDLPRLREDPVYPSLPE